MNSFLTKLFFLAWTVVFASIQVYAQESDGNDRIEARTDVLELVLPAQSAVRSSGRVAIAGRSVPYDVIAGTQPVWNAEGKASAALFYTYYERSDVSDRATRPLVISFNGGPGSASVWMHLAYTGPKTLNIDSEGYPLQPYGVKDNPYSILDVADIVYIDPVNTGFSRILDPDVDKSTFFGINADITYLADWIESFVSRTGRWRSPKYLIGESYGTTRVSGLALELQEKHWMYLNGVILVSPTDIGLQRGGAVGDALKLPYYSATAWYHQMLPPDLQQMDLDEVLLEAEAFTVNELIPALAQGGFLDPDRRREISEQIARYSGLSSDTVIRNNLTVPPAYFWKDLLRDRGVTVGRLDSRYLGIDKRDAGERPDYAAELTSWLHSFTPAINHYLREVLNYKTDLRYNMFGPVHPWDRSNDNTGDNLRKAMSMNPFMHVMIQSGYYDGATTYFDAKYSMWQLDPSGRLRDRLRFEGYRSGHMMYLREEDSMAANEHIRDFIRKSTPAIDQPAKY